jgi:hypothetical protein
VLCCEISHARHKSAQLEADKLKQMVETKASIVRAYAVEARDPLPEDIPLLGKPYLMHLPLTHVVRGDIARLHAGDVVPGSRRSQWQ